MKTTGLVSMLVEKMVRIHCGESIRPIER